MSSEDEVIDAIPPNIDINQISDTLNNPVQIFRMLDKNNDGRVTNEDLQLLLQQSGIKGTASKMLSKYIFQLLDRNHNGVIEASDLVDVGRIIGDLLEKKQNRTNF